MEGKGYEGMSDSKIRELEKRVIEGSATDEEMSKFEDEVDKAIKEGR